MVHGMPAVWNRLNWVKGMTKHYLRKVGFIDKRVQSFFDYDMMCSLIVRRQHAPLKTYLGVFTDWDNSPRRKYRSSVFRGSTPEKFGAHVAAQVRRIQEAGGSELLFVNAWNEWGEGAYLEPDQRFGTRYLEALRSALNQEVLPVSTS